MFKKQKQLKISFILSYSRKWGDKMGIKYFDIFGLWYLIKKLEIKLFFGYI